MPLVLYIAEQHHKCLLDLWIPYLCFFFFFLNKPPPPEFPPLPHPAPLPFSVNRDKAHALPAPPRGFRPPAQRPAAAVSLGLEGEGVRPAAAVHVAGQVERGARVAVRG